MTKQDFSEEDGSDTEKSVCQCSKDRCGVRCTPCLLIWILVAVLVLFNLFRVIAR